MRLPDLSKLPFTRRASDPPNRARVSASDRGSATAELAVSLPALMLMIYAALASVGAVRTQLECVDAAREAARAEARGEPGEAAGRRVAPDGAVIVLSGNGDTVTAAVTVTVHPVGGALPGFTVGATAVAAREPEATGMAGQIQ